MRDEKIEKVIANLDALDGFVTEPGPKTEIEKKVDAELFAQVVGEEPIGLAYGPLRKAATYYIGEAIGVNGKGTIKRGYFDEKGFHVTGIAASTVRPDTERHKNGAQLGIRNKAARRMLRKAFRNAYSRTEQSVLKAHDLVNEVRGYADNAHEGRRNVERLDKAHTPKQLLDGRKARQDMRAARRKHRKKWAKAINRFSKTLFELANA